MSSRIYIHMLTLWGALITIKWKFAIFRTLGWGILVDRVSITLTSRILYSKHLEWMLFPTYPWDDFFNYRKILLYKLVINFVPRLYRVLTMFRMKAIGHNSMYRLHVTGNSSYVSNLFLTFETITTLPSNAFCTYYFFNFIISPSLP